MYEETKVRFNWKSLIIKLLIIAIILVLIIILFPLIVNKKDSSEVFKENATTRIGIINQVQENEDGSITAILDF